LNEATSSCRYRFGVYDADAATGELRRQGLRIKLHSQPFQLLLLLLDSPGELLTREEIARRLWPADTFVDYDHGVNSAINRIRDALGDRAANPRFIETLARRGYRFIAPVQRLDATGATVVANTGNTAPSTPPTTLMDRVLTQPEDLPLMPHPTVKTLLILFQLMYLGFYIGALANLAEINDLISVAPYASQLFITIIVTAAILIPVRAFLLCAVIFRAPGFAQKFRRIWWLLLPLDVLWSLSPFLLLHHINSGLALACMTLLLYAPFAQRSLVLILGDLNSADADSPIR
jgi:cholera toxin transcriptional activator